MFLYIILFAKDYLLLYKPDIPYVDLLTSASISKASVGILFSLSPSFSVIFFLYNLYHFYSSLAVCLYLGVKISITPQLRSPPTHVWVRFLSPKEAAAAALNELTMTIEHSIASAAWD